MKKLLALVSLSLVVLFRLQAQGIVLVSNIAAPVSTNATAGGAASGLMTGIGPRYYFALYYSTNSTSVNGQTAAIVGTPSGTSGYVFNDSSWKLAAYCTNIATPGRLLSASRNASGYTVIPDVPEGAFSQFVIVGWSANIGTTVGALQTWLNNGSPSLGWIGQSSVSGPRQVGGNVIPIPPPQIFGTGTDLIPAFTLGVVVGMSSPPYFFSQPASQTVVAGNNATFSCTVSGTPTPTYQWRFNNTNIFGANTSSYTVTNAQPTDAGNYSVLVANFLGSLASTDAVLTVQGNSTQPTILGQPANLTVSAGGNASFTVSAGGTAPLAYQWSLNGTNLVNATNATLALNNVQPTSAGNYSVSITNPFGATNAAAVLTVQTFPPLITAQPQNISVPAGSSATFNITATGTATLNYQWTLNGTNLSGTTNANLTIANAQAGNAGTYAVTVSNAYGSTNSANVSLTVTPLLNYGYVILTSGANSATKMFTNSVIGGAPTGLTSSNGILFRYALFASTNAMDINGGTNAIVGAASVNYAFNDLGWTLGAYGTNTLIPGRMRSAQANASGFTPIPISGSAGAMARFVLIGWSANIGTNISAVQTWFNNGNPVTDGWIGQSAVSGAMLMGDGGSLPPTVLFGSGAQQLRGLTLGLASPNPAANYPPPAVPPPVLSSKVAGPLLKLSWPVAYSSYGLQSCSQPVGTWEDVAGSPVSDGTNWTVTILLVTQQPYYRLIVLQ